VTVVNNLDEWWKKRSAFRRYDRSAVYVGALVGTLCTGLSQIIVGPVPDGGISELSRDVQIFLSWELFLGAGMALTGSFSGSRYFLPLWTRTRSYNIGMAAAPLIAVSMIYYAYAIWVSSKNFASALGSTLSPAVAVAILINAGYLWLELRRIKRNANIIKHDAGGDEYDGPE
jgi:hypothetical protein